MGYFSELLSVCKIAILENWGNGAGRLKAGD